jgi:uncharacterized membrane protein
MATQPAPDRVRPNESRWPVILITAAALVIYALLPSSITVLPPWLVPALGGLLLIPLLAVDRLRLDAETAWSRWLGVGFAIGLTAVNQVHIVLIVIELVNGQADGPGVLLTAFAVWLTNVVAFALVYWELDRGGPVVRRVKGRADHEEQDFRFPQQDGSPGPKNWMPEFFDYLYFSLSNMMAFSPTDVMPLSRRAKALMAYQALAGFVILALVISRAVNILT